MYGNEKQRMSAIILAAGKGKRMNSDVAKVLHPTVRQASADLFS